ncbi:hypothetical protein BZA77DRAFT_310189 [Pyronema omphalodes]|nr:hypothetical protein BZA77DRAFT_310189 [Pyronema omphalodes]
MSMPPMEHPSGAPLAHHPTDTPPMYRNSTSLHPCAKTYETYLTSTINGVTNGTTYTKTSTITKTMTATSCEPDSPHPTPTNHLMSTGYPGHSMEHPTTVYLSAPAITQTYTKTLTSCSTYPVTYSHNSTIFVTATISTQYIVSTSHETIYPAPVWHTKTPTHESPVSHSLPAHQTPSMHQTPPMHEPSPPMHHSSPPMQHTPSPVHHSSPPMHESAPPMQHTPSPVHHTPAMNYTSPMHQAPPMNHTSPMHEAPSMHHTAPHIAHTNPPMHHTTAPAVYHPTAVIPTGYPLHTAPVSSGMPPVPGNSSANYTSPSKPYQQPSSSVNVIPSVLTGAGSSLALPGLTVFVATIIAFL